MLELEDWRNINYFTSELVSTALCICFGYCLSCVKRLKFHYKVIVAYLGVAVILETWALFIIKFQLPEAYYNRNGHLYVSLEAVLLGYFMWGLLKTHQYFKLIPIVCFVVVILYETVSHWQQPYPDNDHSSAFLATIYLLPLLFVLYHISLNQARKDFFRIPSVIIILAFLISYVALLLIFWLLPSLASYSKILGNQVLIFKNGIAIVFYISIAFAIEKASK